MPAISRKSLMPLRSCCKMCSKRKKSLLPGVRRRDGSAPMMTKVGLNSVIRSLAIEYAKEGIRFNTLAAAVVDTPMHKDESKDFLKTLQPMGQIADVTDVVDAVLYLARAPQVSGEVLHVDGGAHAGRW